MSILKFLARHRLLGGALVVGFLLSGCVPARFGVSWANLTVVGEGQHILVAYNDFMVLVDPANGRPVPLRNADGEIRTDETGSPRRWEVQGRVTGSQFFAAPIWLTDQTLLVADYNQRLMRVNFNRADVQPGSEVLLPGHVIADPIAADGIVYVPLSDRDVVAYNLETTTQLWRFETRRGIWSAPVVEDGRVYFASMDHHFYAVDAVSGTEIWRIDLGGALPAGPQYHDEHFYVGSFARRVYDVSIDGRVVAEYETEDWVWNTPVIYDDLLYTTDMSGFVYALDTQNNLAEVWKIQVGEAGIRSRPLVTEQFVIVADREGRVHWIERATGNIMFNQAVDAEILSDIILIEPTEATNIPDPLVVISTVNNDKVLVAFTLDGAPRWTYDR